MISGETPAGRSSDVQHRLARAPVSIKPRVINLCHRGLDRPPCVWGKTPTLSRPSVVYPARLEGAMAHRYGRVGFRDNLLFEPSQTGHIIVKEMQSLRCILLDKTSEMLDGTGRFLVLSCWTHLVDRAVRRGSPLRCFLGRARSRPAGTYGSFADSQKNGPLHTYVTVHTFRLCFDGPTAWWGMSVNVQLNAARGSFQAG